VKLQESGFFPKGGGQWHAQTIKQILNAHV